MDPVFGQFIREFQGTIQWKYQFNALAYSLALTSEPV